jgi:hypothetical protein
MTAIETVKELATAAEAVAAAGAMLLGTVSALATLLSHVPKLPARLSEFFARLGVATSKYTVNKRPPGDPEGPK